MELVMTEREKNNILCLEHQKIVQHKFLKLN